MRGDLELFLIIVAALDGADIPIVGGLGICRRKRESGFQRGLWRLPINDISEFHAIAGVTRG